MAMLELARNNGVAIGILADTLTIYYECTPTMAAAHTIDLAATRAMSQLDRVTALVVIEASARTPEQAVRDAIQQTMQRFEKRTDALAYAVLGRGFGNAATRAAISGILMFVRPNYPAKVFSSLVEAMRWLQFQKGKSPSNRMRDDSAEYENFCTCDRRQSA